MAPRRERSSLSLRRAESKQDELASQGTYSGTETSGRRSQRLCRTYQFSLRHQLVDTSLRRQFLNGQRDKWTYAIAFGTPEDQVIRHSFERFSQPTD